MDSPHSVCDLCSGQDGARPPLKSMLGINRLVDVISLLKKCGLSDANWYDLGLNLGLFHSTLKSIESDYPFVANRMRECLSLWLYKVDDVVKRGGPTWSSLGGAIRAMDETAVADGLEKQVTYMSHEAVSILDSHTKQTWCISNVEDVVKLLRGENVFSDDVAAMVVGICDQSEQQFRLLIAIRTAVHTEYTHLSTFAYILMKCALDVKLGKAIHDDYIKLISGGNTEAAWDILSPGKGIPVLQNMRADFHWIRYAFGKAFSHFKKIILKKPPSLEELKDFLNDHYPDISPHLTTATSLKDVLRLIKEECTLTDIQPIQGVIEEFDITEAETYIKDYIVTLEDFCKSVSIQLCLKKNFALSAVTNLPLQCEVATFDFDWEPGDHMLKDIRAILSKASGGLVKIRFIDNICSISVTCTFRYSLIKTVIMRLLENLDMLKDNGLMKLTVGFTIIFPSEPFNYVQYDDNVGMTSLKATVNVKSDLHHQVTKNSGSITADVPPISSSEIQLSQLGAVENVELQYMASETSLVGAQIYPEQIYMAQSHEESRQGNKESVVPASPNLIIHNEGIKGVLVGPSSDDQSPKSVEGGCIAATYIDESGKPDNLTRDPYDVRHTPSQVPTFTDQDYSSTDELTQQDQEDPSNDHDMTHPTSIEEVTPTLNKMRNANKKTPSTKETSPRIRRHKKTTTPIYKGATSSNKKKGFFKGPSTAIPRTKNSSGKEASTGKETKESIDREDMITAENETVLIKENISSGKNDTVDKNIINVRDTSSMGAEAGSVLISGWEKFNLINQGIWSLTIADIKAIILRQTVPCHILCSFSLGLPFSENSSILQHFLSSTLLTHPQLPNHVPLLIEDNLFSYNISVLQSHDDSQNRHLWFGQSETLNHLLTCGTSTLQKMLLRRQRIKIVERSDCEIFANQTLNRHIVTVCENISCIDNLNLELQSLIASGAVFMNLFNVGLKRGILEVLKIISQHIKNNLGLIFLSIDDVQKLNEVPHVTQDNSTILQLETKLSCILNFVNMMLLASCKNYITIVITCKNGTSKKDKNNAYKALQTILETEVKKSHLPPNVSTMVVEESSRESLKELKATFDNAIRRQCVNRSNIKLSWLFLHSAMVSTNRVVMSYDDLKAVAAELNIGSEEFNDFLQRFTSSAKILHFSEYKLLKDFVILQPVAFVNALSFLFQNPDPSESQFNGVFTMEQVYHIACGNKLFARALMNTLSSFGLAALTDENKVSRKTSPLSKDPPELLFVPLARNGILKRETFTNSLHIVYDSIPPVVDCQGFFTAPLLKLENVSLEGNHELNMINFLISAKRKNYYFFLVFQPTHIEVYIEFNSETEGMFESIVHCCIQALENVTEVTEGLFKYSFALICLTPGQHHGGRYDLLIKEKLPNHQSLCYHCEAQPTSVATRKKWKDTVYKISEDDKKEKDRASAERLFLLARELGPILKTSQALRGLAAQLRVQRDREVTNSLTSNCYPWQRILMILWCWEKRVGTNEATREELKKALSRLGYGPNVLR